MLHVSVQKQQWFLIKSAKFVVINNLKYSTLTIMHNVKVDSVYCLIFKHHFLTVVKAK